jgi:LysR family transcriptional regulator, glycine cleavage system transcriptional activator
MRKIPPLNSIKAFDAVARNGSLSKAAKELNVSSSAVSQQIVLLEDWMGIKLLNRSSNKTSLSEAGLKFSEKVNIYFDNLEAGVIDTKRNDTVAEIKVSILPSLATRWFMSRLPNYSALHPECRVMVETSFNLTDFNQDEVSVAIRSGSGVYKKCHSIKLFNENVAPVCSPKYWEMHQIQLNEIATCNLLADHSPRRQETNLDWNIWMSKEGIDLPSPLKPNQTFTDSNLTIQACVNGEGFMLGRTILIADEIRKGTLITPFLNKQISDWPYYLVYPVDAHPPQKQLREFLYWLEGEAKKTEGTTDQYETEYFL